MTEPATVRPKISDPDFQRAVELIDAGDASGLRDWVTDKPQLLTATADEDGSAAGDYFAHPRLIWFVAENPIRNGTLPGNIAEVTQVLVDLSRQHQVDDLVDQLNYTVALVASSLVARQCGVQQVLVEALVRGGADPNSGIQSGLAHREIEACQLLLRGGADLTLSLAAGLGRQNDTERLAADASPGQLQEALAMAAINGQATCAAILLSHGAKVNEFNPDGVHAHSTPLHQAVYADSIETVRVLLDHGADPTIQDKIFQSDPRDWANHEGRTQIATLLNG